MMASNDISIALGNRETYKRSHFCLYIPKRLKPTETSPFQFLIVSADGTYFYRADYAPS